MLRLFEIEWKKISYNRGTKIFILLYFLMMTGTVLIIPSIKPTVGEESIDLIQLGLLGPKVIWTNLTYIMSFGKILLAIIIINSITNEYTYGTYRQNIIDGLSKKEYFISKMAMGIVITLATTLLVGLMILLLGSYYNKGEHLLASFEFIVALFVEYLGYMTLALFIAFLLRRSTFAILSLFAIPFSEGILAGIERTSRVSKESITYFTDYLPFRANGGCTTFFNVDLMQYLSTGSAFNPKTVEWTPIVISLSYTLIFTIATYYILKRRDVK